MWGEHYLCRWRSLKAGQSHRKLVGVTDLGRDAARGKGYDLLVKYDFRFLVPMEMVRYFVVICVAGKV